MGLKKPLVIVSSYSGNTEEAISSYQAAQKMNLPIVINTSGGQLAQNAQKDGFPMATIDFLDMQPRHTLLASFTGVYAALRNSQLAQDIDTELTNTATFLEEETANLEQPALDLANQIKGRTPVFISSDRLGFAAKNFKIQTNENAKYPAFWNTFPELNHNEMLGFSKLKDTQNPNKFIAVFLRHSDDHPRVRTRMDITADLYKKWGVATHSFDVKGSTTIAKIFYAVTFGLWTSYHLATSYDIDPVPVDGVEDFKKRLK
jgi:glucose/mannose-6-phosphate isomerase